MGRAELINNSIIEMGKRVGLKWETFEDALRYQKENGITWYLTKEWTAEEQNDFKDWMDDYFNKHTQWSSRKRDIEIWTFILCYGWKTKQEPH